MPIETIEYKGTTYPAFQTTGNAARWIMPFAENYIKPNMAVVDIGFCKDEWRFKDAYGVDPSVIPEHGDAMNFIGDGIWDAIFSSHCLEHVKENWMTVLDYWLTKIKIGGVIFLYLPHKSQEYWLPENNRKHIHSFSGNEIADYLNNLGHKVIKSGVDLNNSFVVVCEKKRTTEKAGWANFGANADVKPFAEYLKEKGINTENVQGTVYDGLRFGLPDANGDVLMPGAFDKSTNENKRYYINTDTYPTGSNSDKSINENPNILKTHNPDNSKDKFISGKWINGEYRVNKIPSDSLVAPLSKQQIIEIGIKKFESGHLPLSTVLSEIYDCGYNADV